MANRMKFKIGINKEQMLELFKKNGISIRKLGPMIGYSEKTIRRALNSGAMSPELFYAIHQFLEPDLLETIMISADDYNKRLGLYSVGDHVRHDGETYECKRRMINEFGA